MSQSHDEKLAMIAAMRAYGGSFAVALSECFLLADANNLIKLYATFPEEVQLYSGFAAHLAEKEKKENDNVQEG